MNSTELILKNSTIHRATGCTLNTDTQHMRDNGDITNILPPHTHLKLHASQIRAPHLLKHTIPRQKKQTIINTLDTSKYTKNVTLAHIKQNVKRTHTITGTTYMSTRMVDN